MCIAPGAKTGGLAPATLPTAEQFNNFRSAYPAVGHGKSLAMPPANLLATLHSQLGFSFPPRLLNRAPKNTAKNIQNMLYKYTNMCILT